MSMVTSGRPEHVAPPEIYYDAEEAVKYARNSRMIKIQTQMSERALELLNLPDEEPRMLLDIGCGSGLSGELLSHHDHNWVGMDISPFMLKVALERRVEGDLFLADMGCGVPFRPGVFDGAISISALQWLFTAERKEEVPFRRLLCFFETLYSCLRRGSRAVLQFYPENSKQMEMATAAATTAGFSGGMIIDFPNSKRARKFFLCLFAGPSSDPRSRNLDAKEGNPNRAEVAGRSRSGGSRRGKNMKSTKDWIHRKKERRLLQGKKVKKDSKYTGRKRQDAF